MSQTRAQLSVETMIVYGMVILVALSVIGGLLYFNILDIGSYLPDKCDIGGSSDLRCEEISLSTSSNTLEMGIRNTGQKPIEVLDVSVTDDTGVHFSGTLTGSADDTSGNPISTSNALAPGEIAAVSINIGSGGAQGKVLRGEVVTSYKFKDGAITQEASGSLRIRAS